MKSFLLEIVQVGLVNGRHYEVGRIAQQQPSVMTSGIQTNAYISYESQYIMQPCKYSDQGNVCLISDMDYL